LVSRKSDLIPSVGFVTGIAISYKMRLASPR
jgi:hypothetical protein